jgi:hypothetical protein
VISGSQEMGFSAQECGGRRGRREEPGKRVGMRRNPLFAGVIPAKAGIQELPAKAGTSLDPGSSPGGFPRNPLRQKRLNGWRHHRRECRDARRACPQMSHFLSLRAERSNPLSFGDCHVATLLAMTHKRISGVHGCAPETLPDPVFSRSQAPAWERILRGSASPDDNQDGAGGSPGRARRTRIPRLEPGNERRLGGNRP